MVKATVRVTIEYTESYDIEQYTQEQFERKLQKHWRAQLPCSYVHTKVVALPVHSAAVESFIRNDNTKRGVN